MSTAAEVFPSSPACASPMFPARLVNSSSVPVKGRKVFFFFFFTSECLKGVKSD